MMIENRAITFIFLALSFFRRKIFNFVLPKLAPRLKGSDSFGFGSTTTRGCLAVTDTMNSSYTVN